MNAIIHPYRSTMLQTPDQAYKLKGRRISMNTLNQAVVIFTSFVWGDKAPAGFNPTPVAGEIKFSHTSTDNWGRVRVQYAISYPVRVGVFLVFFPAMEKRPQSLTPTKERGVK